MDAPLFQSLAAHPFEAFDDPVLTIGVVELEEIERNDEMDDAISDEARVMGVGGQWKSTCRHDGEWSIEKSQLRPGTQTQSLIPIKRKG